MCDIHLTCKVANKCLNVREWIEVVEWNKRWSSPFPCSPVSRQILWRKTLMEKKIDGFEWFWMVSLHKNIQLMQKFLKAPFLVLHFSYYILITFCDIAIYADDTTPFSECNQASDLWQQLELASGLESDLPDTGVRSSLFISMLGKLSWFGLTNLITMVLLMWK